MATRRRHCSALGAWIGVIECSPAGSMRRAQEQVQAEEGSSGLGSAAALLAGLQALLRSGTCPEQMPRQVAMHRAADGGMHRPIAAGRSRWRRRARASSGMAPCRSRSLPDPLVPGSAHPVHQHRSRALPGPQPMSNSPSVDAAVLKSGREQCWKVGPSCWGTGVGLVGTPGRPKCSRARWPHAALPRLPPRTLQTHRRPVTPSTRAWRPRA